MPITRKLTSIGTSRGITLPKSWIENYEKINGIRITEIAMEVNGSIIIRPILQKKEA